MAHITETMGIDLFVWDDASGDVITDFGAGHDGTVGDPGVTMFTDANDFFDLSGILNGTTLADYNAAAGANLATAIPAMKHDIADGVINFESNDLAGPTLKFLGRNSLEADETGVVCFVRGTMIATPSGEVPIENLRAGDLVVTADNGPQPLVMSAYRNLSTQDLVANPRLKPVLLQPGALGYDRPLIVSPQHAMLVEINRDQVLARATDLADHGGGFVRRMQGCRGVTYLHLVFDAHQIIFANGRPTESLFPGEQALRAMAPAALDELMSVFPDLTSVLASDADQRLPAQWAPARTYSQRNQTPPLAELSQAAV